MKKASVQTYCLTVAYLGTPYSGWQRQPGKDTVQEKIEAALHQIYKTQVHANASGRTDTGVHALAQTVSIQAPASHTPEVMRRALNNNLPLNIRVKRVQKKPNSFHARFSATGKTYEYRIWNDEVEDPFALDRALHVPRPLNLTLMRQAARCLVGRHDFASFTSNPGYERETTVRTISYCAFARRGALITFTITADGFLYRMVRNIVGGLIKVGQGRLDVEEFKRVLEARSRSAAPNTAPAHGLYLKHVYYGKTT
jgi:tRNA pseudouridine38-40 synthase